MDINLHFKPDIKEEKSPEKVSSEKSEDVGLSNHIHFMPCSIDYNGEAAVDKFFDKYITVEKNSQTSNVEYNGSFRGYPLKGSPAVAPDGFTFILMKETKMDEESRAMKESERYDQFTYWNVSDNPSSRDPFFKAMKWVDASDIIHSE